MAASDQVNPSIVRREGARRMPARSGASARRWAPVAREEEEESDMSAPLPHSTEKHLRRWLAWNVRQRREKMGLSLHRAAAISDLHWRHWQKVEAGDCNATLATLQRLADALSVNAEVLLRPAMRSQ
jgi:hypothetical protein